MKQYLAMAFVILILSLGIAVAQTTTGMAGSG